MVTEKEDFKVATPYQPTEDEKKAIKELVDKGLVGEDWDSGKKHIKSFKELIKQAVEGWRKLKQLMKMVESEMSTMR